LQYTIYFGIQLEIELIEENFTELSFNPDLLENNVIYNWQIIAFDGKFQTFGDVRSFHTTLASPPFF